jgi:hypothetical protein
MPAGHAQVRKPNFFIPLRRRSQVQLLLHASVFFNTVFRTGTGGGVSLVTNTRAVRADPAVLFGKEQKCYAVVQLRTGLKIPGVSIREETGEIEISSLHRVLRQILHRRVRLRSGTARTQ